MSVSAHRILNVIRDADHALNDPGAGGRIEISGDLQICELVTLTAESRTLDDPIKAGIRLTIRMKTDGGDCTVTAANGFNVDGDTQAVFANVGDQLELISVSHTTGFRWEILVNTGPAALLGGAAEWNPLSLFASGEKGYIYDPTDLANLKQLSNGTTAVTTAGDPVGYLADLSGNGNHAIQATSTKRLQVQTDGFAYYLKGDATDDFLRRTFAAQIPQPWTRATCFTQITWSDGGYVLDNGGTTNANALWQTSSSPLLRAFYGAGVVVTSDAIVNGVTVAANRPQLGIPMIMVETANGASSQWAMQYDDMKTENPGTLAADGVTLLGNRFDAGSSNIRFNRGLMIDRALTSDELANVRKWLVSKFTRKIVFEGDSLSCNGYADHPIVEACAAAATPCLPIILAVGGSRLITNSADLVYRKQAVIRAILAAAPAVVDFACWIGHNDCPPESVTPGSSTAWLASYATYLSDIRAACPNLRSVIIGTILSRNDVSFPYHNASRATVNPLIRSFATAQGAICADFAAHPTIGVDAACDDTNLYQTDKIHPDYTKATPRGYIKDVWLTAINAAG